MSNAQHALTNRDRVEIAVGSAVLAFPVATTEEVWNLSIELSWLRITAIAAISLVVVSLFVLLVFRRADGHPDWRAFLHRVVAVYLFTTIVCAAILVALDRLPLLSDVTVAVKRTVLVAFPASFSATVVDSLS
jgi:uncharacterized membrane protein